MYTEYTNCADSNLSSYVGMAIERQELVGVACQQTSLVINAFLLLIARPCFKSKSPAATPFSTQPDYQGMSSVMTSGIVED
ncbi:hypothetical protein H9Q69_007401 [Fusarium xylarioides]|nr:hypothetical protein H9Q69_007401 [Fusarium xylarioides]KAG5801032.1 hypothetical protein H9Q71_014385 [Fusarium xylarioides]